MGTLSHKLAYLEQTKIKIREALKFKGAKVTDEDTFRSYADYIRKIEGAAAGRVGELFARGGIGIGGRTLIGEAQWVTPISAIPGDGSITFSWKPITEAVSYAISVYTSDGLNLVTRILDLDSETTSHKITGLTNGTEYAVTAYYKDSTMSAYRYISSNATTAERVAHGLTATPIATE